MKAWLLFSLCHCYVGLRWNPMIQRFYFFPVPCCGIVVEVADQPDDTIKSTIALAYTMAVSYLAFSALTIGALVAWVEK